MKRKKKDILVHPGNFTKKLPNQTERFVWDVRKRWRWEDEEVTYRSIQPPFFIHGKVSAREKTFNGHDAHFHCSDFHDACKTHEPSATHGARRPFPQHRGVSAPFSSLCDVTDHRIKSFGVALKVFFLSSAGLSAPDWPVQRSETPLLEAD